MTGYKTEIATGHILEYFNLSSKPVDTTEYTWTECAVENLPECWKPTVLVYNPNDLIEWAMSQGFASGLVPHYAAFVDFARHAGNDSKTMLLSYASAFGLTDVCNIVIAKAIELGADITV